MNKTQPSKALVPAIRFKGFTDAWEQRKLKNVLKVNSGRDYKDLKPGNIPVYGTGGFMLNVNDQLSSDDAIGIGRKGTIDRPQFLRAPFWTVDTLFFMTSEGNNSLRFLYAWCQLVQWKRYDESTGVPSLSKGTLNKIPLNVPSLSEQNSIGEFFNILDNLIASNRRKGKILKDLKKALLQKMFVSGKETIPDIRFSGYADAWEQRKLKDVADYRNGKAHEKNVTENGSYVIVNSKFVSTNGRVKKYSDKQIAPLYKGEISFVLSDVPNGRAIARTFQIDKTGIYSLNQRIAGIKVHKNTDMNFLNYLMNRNSYFLKFDNGVGQTNLSKSEVVNFPSYYPTLDEQEKIGLTLTYLDFIIASNQRKGKILRNLKKALLQRMFV